eukprot:TRINITY_DN4015_c0_g1::TRINITY_DN4015_c0_g1_i1::g.11978::m.11978 TRINITY_DN4015_c0_g1::TRINITY_DN4015_c0_g1_i1::g.11978  ORF type:complete len:562 (+),score=104.23,DnaI_N/PF07319.6/0.032 TRINITY_DN4015_c0_g1_i1:33-1688(+)
MVDFVKLFEAHAEDFKKYRHIKLLRRIEQVTAEIFEAEYLKDFSEADRPKLRRATIEANFQGIEEFSEEFYHALELASKRQELARKFVILALTTFPDSVHGFNPFDATLIKSSAKISSLYDVYYVAWLKAVQGNEVAKRLENVEENDVKHVLGKYTIILEQDGKFYDIPYYEHFKEQLTPIAESFRQVATDLNNLPEAHKSGERMRYVLYFECYRDAILETDPVKQEEKWTELDMIWCDIVYDIQIVHDIESGYGDPLRVKVIPDFSLRLIDDDYIAANEKIRKIQNRMEDYFRERDTDFARNGLGALRACFPAIYYIPFQCGMSLHFRFCGQSIPNRPQVKNEKGVKIYFDAVMQQKRCQESVELARIAFADPTVGDCVNALDVLVYHVAAHEVGHAIYPLEELRSVMRADAVSLMEEPRADLASVHTLYLMAKAGNISESDAHKYLLATAILELRRFAKFHSVTTRPYTISAIYAYRVFSEQGYFKLQDGKINVDPSKTMDVLATFSHMFEKILDAQDARDGAKLESILDHLQSEHELCTHLVQLYKSV